jgi:hypothetical protein
METRKEFAGGLVIREVPGQYRMFKQLLGLVLADLSSLYGVKLEVPRLHFYEQRRESRAPGVVGVFNHADFSIWIRQSRKPIEQVETLFHEAVHLAQAVRLGRSKMSKTTDYQANNFGYWRSRVEVEARTHSSNFLRRYQKEIKRILSSF